MRYDIYSECKATNGCLIDNGIHAIIISRPNILVKTHRRHHGKGQTNPKHNQLGTNHIYIFCSGPLIEGNSHDELMAHNGKYAEMYRVQAKKYCEA